MRHTIVHLIVTMTAALLATMRVTTFAAMIAAKLVALIDASVQIVHASRCTACLRNRGA